MSHLALIVVFILCTLCNGLPSVDRNEVLVKSRRLLQESFADLINRNDVETAPIMIQAMAADFSSAVLVAESLTIIDSDAEKAYIFSDNFGRAVGLGGDEVIGFLGEVILQAETIAPFQMAQVIVAAVSQGVQQTDAMVTLLGVAAESARCQGIANIITQAYDFAQIQGKTRDLAETLAQSGAASCALCEDYEPTADASCAERKEWGECEAEWMVFGYFCAQTCNYCRTNQATDFAKAVAVRTTSLNTDQVPLEESPSSSLKPVPVSMVKGVTEAESLQQAIVSGATKVASSNLLDFLKAGQTEQVGDALLSVAPDYTAATTLTLTIALRNVGPAQEEELYSVFLKLLPSYPDIVADAMQQAARRPSGVNTAGDLLLQILEVNDGQYPSLVAASAEKCNGIPAIIEYVVGVSDQIVAPFVQDNEPVLLCLQNSDQVITAIAEQAQSFVPVPAEATVPQLESLDAAVVPVDSQLSGVVSGDFSEAVGVLVSAAVEAQQTGDTSVFTASLNSLILADQGNQVTLTIAAAFLGGLSPEEELALSFGLSEVVSFGSEDVSPIIATGLAIAQTDGGCDAIDTPLLIISQKASEQNSTARWGAALGQHTDVVSQCLGDEVRLCTGFASRDCCEQDIKPARCNFCGFQFNKQCRFELETQSIPSLDFYVYRDKRFNNILCKCPNLLTA